MISSVVMASGNVNKGSSGPEFLGCQQTENGEAIFPSQQNNVQDAEHYGYGALSLSIDSGTSSAELSQLLSDPESRF